MENGENSAWSMIVRTAVLDDFIMQKVKNDDIDTVLNLAAGLDTRPYRLELPLSLRWIEVDLQDILSYKEQKLAEAIPKCELERIRLDLTDTAGRKKLFEDINREARSVLVISEGLLVYLTEENVVDLASDLYSQPHFNWWIFDILTPVLFEWLLKNSFRRFDDGDVKMHFAPEEGPAFFQKYGWKESEVRMISKESRRLKREMPKAWLFRLLKVFASKKMKEFYSKMDSYLVLLEHR